jgi:hypothetical protein
VDINIIVVKAKVKSYHHIASPPAYKDHKESSSDEAKMDLWNGNFYKLTEPGDIRMGE